MKKIISVVLILTMILTLGISSFSVSAKYYQSSSQWKAISKFDFTTRDDENALDYSTYDGIWHTVSPKLSNGAQPGATLAFGYNGGSVYKVNTDEGMQNGLYMRGAGATGTTAAPGTVALKLHNVIDSTKFVAGKKYKISMKLKVKEFAYVNSTKVSGKYYYLDVTDKASEDVPFTTEQALEATGGKINSPQFFVLPNIGDGNAASVNGVSLSASSKPLDNNVWTTIELPAFTAVSGMGTPVAGKGTSYTAFKTLPYASIRLNVKTTTATIGGTAYTLIPKFVSVDDIIIYEEEAVYTDNPNYTKTYDGSSLENILSCGDGAAAPELATDFGYNDETSIKETVTANSNAGIRVLKLFGDIAPINEDIGKTFEISAYVYPVKTEAIPEDSEGTYMEMTMASAYSTANVHKNGYRKAQFFLPWNQWSKVTIYHRVSDITSMNYDAGDGNNYICDAVRIQGATLNSAYAGGNSVKEFYVDNITVKEVTDVPGANEIVMPEVSQTMYPATNGSNAVFSEITITPSSTIYPAYICTYMLPTSLATATKFGSALTTEIGNADKKVLSIPRIIGGEESGTIKVFSVLTDIPEDKKDTDITSRVVYSLSSPYLYSSNYSTVISSVNTINSANGSVNGLAAPAGE